MPSAEERVAYTDEFIERVKTQYPHDERLHRLMDDGAFFAGRYLDDFSNGRIDPKDVVAAVEASENGDEELLQKLKSDAEDLIRREELYKEWGKQACGN